MQTSLKHSGSFLTAQSTQKPYQIATYNEKSMSRLFFEPDLWYYH